MKNSLTRTEQFAMACARQRILSSQEHRQRAIAEFPLRVANAAHILKRCCDNCDRFGGYISPEVTRFMAEIEDHILKEFREAFGQEMIAPEDNRKDW